MGVLRRPPGPSLLVLISTYGSPRVPGRVGDRDATDPRLVQDAPSYDIGRHVRRGTALFFLLFPPRGTGVSTPLSPRGLRQTYPPSRILWTRYDGLYYPPGHNVSGGGDHFVSGTGDDRGLETTMGLGGRRTPRNGGITGPPETSYCGA